MGGLPINNRDLMGVNGISWDLIGIMYHGISLAE
jgi:hypothetical protein